MYKTHFTCQTKSKLDKNDSNCLFTIVLHGGPKFGPLPPPSRDSICMPSQVWSTDFFFEIFDHMINSRRIRRFGPFFLFELDQTCVFDDNLSRDQKFRRVSQWIKLVTACICCHVFDLTNDSR